MLLEFSGHRFVYSQAFNYGWTKGVLDVLSVYYRKTRACSFIVHVTQPTIVQRNDVMHSGSSLFRHIADTFDSLSDTESETESDIGNLYIIIFL